MANFGVQIQKYLKNPKIAKKSYNMQNKIL